MKNVYNKVNFLVCCMVFLLSTSVLAQKDSVRSEILAFTEYKTEIIDKGRGLILEKLLNNDKNKVAEIFDYLISKEDKDYLAFYPAEKLLLNYWLQRYDAILKEATNVDKDYTKTYYSIIRPQRDLLYTKLEAIIREQNEAIKEQVSYSVVNNIDRAFLLLNLQSLVAKETPEERHSLNATANTFLSSYSESGFESYVREYIRFQYSPSKWGFGFEFFSGYGIFTDQLATRFKNSIPMGIAFDIAYKRLNLSLRDYIGFSKTRDSILLNNTTWRKNAQVRIYLPEASLGFIATDNKYVKLSPFAGIASTSVSPTDYDKNRIPDYENVELKFTTTCTAGVCVDLKLGKSKKPLTAIKQEDSNTLIRLRYAFNAPQYSKKYSGFNGNFHSITLGVGGFARLSKRKL